MAPAARVEKAGRLAHVVYLYELWTGLYMLDAWEKAFFSAEHVFTKSNHPLSHRLPLL